MKKKNIVFLSLSAGLLLAFILFTILVKVVDVQAIGAKASEVGFAGINGAIHNLLGVNFVLYNLTDWGSILPIAIAGTFAVVGLVQWIKRKSLRKVDKNLYALAILYVLAFAVYAFFEFVVINRRPVLIKDVLEASYPSSTTVLSILFLIALINQITIYVKNKKLNFTLKTLSVAYCLFLVVGRIISGVHWATDIFAGILISFSLLFLYWALCNIFTNKPKQIHTLQAEEVEE